MSASPESSANFIGTRTALGLVAVLASLALF